MKRVRAKHGEMTLGELTELILILFVIILVSLSPIPKYIYIRIRNLPEPEIQYQFEHLTEDVMIELFETVSRYKNNIRKEIIYRGVKW